MDRIEPAEPIESTEPADPIDAIEPVDPTDRIDGPGPQRLVVGRDGDWWYTPDHYASFIELGKETR